MERVAFLIERTGDRLGCLLNPASLLVRRLAGLHTRHSTSGPLARAGSNDDPLLFTGGGTTELTLDLLFDVTLAGSSIKAEDVRELTRPLLELAGGVESKDGDGGEPPLVRLVWGKHWNVPGLISAVAERLENFTPEGAPRRSWLRIRLIRTADPPARSSRAALAPPSLLPRDLAADAERFAAPKIVERGQNERGIAEQAGTARLDEIAYRYLGDPRHWRLIAALNNIDNPLEAVSGRLLQLPRTV
jgi:hypothetical protein